MSNKFKELIPYIVMILSVVIIRTFFYTPIRVNGSSMEPTLIDKEIMILDKISPKLNGFKRFDIIVLKEGNTYLIKRIIGLPNEKIKYIDNQLYINGKEIKDPYVNKSITEFEEVTIAKDMYFALGDNRGYSKDSRMIGSIAKEEILGKTNLVLFPFKKFGKVK